MLVGRAFPWCFMSCERDYAVSRREIIDLFTNLIGTCILLLLASSPSHLRVSLLGDIQTCEELYEAGRRYYSLTFTTQDAAK